MGRSTEVRWSAVAPPRDQWLLSRQATLFVTASARFLTEPRAFARPVGMGERTERKRGRQPTPADGILRRGGRGANLVREASVSRTGGGLLSWSHGGRSEPSGPPRSSGASAPRSRRV